jgi:hypothetical protein
MGPAHSGALVEDVVTAPGWYDSGMDKRLQQFRTICKTHHVGLAYAFGSEADELAAILGGTPPRHLGPMADLDLGVVFLPPLASLGEPARSLYCRLSSSLGDLFSPVPLDLVLLEETHSLLRVQAISGMCVYSADDSFRMDFEMDALRRAADFRYHFEQYHRERREALG